MNIQSEDRAGSLRTDSKLALGIAIGTADLAGVTITKQTTMNDAMNDTFDDTTRILTPHDASDELGRIMMDYASGSDADDEHDAYNDPRLSLTPPPSPEQTGPTLQLCFECNAYLDDYLPGFSVDGHAHCGLCYGTKVYTRLPREHPWYKIGQCRRLRHDGEVASMKPVTCVYSDDEHEAYAFEDWVPIRARRRLRAEVFRPVSPEHADLPAEGQ